MRGLKRVKKTKRTPKGTPSIFRQSFKKLLKCYFVGFKNGGSGETRTPDHSVMSQSLTPLYFYISLYIITFVAILIFKIIQKYTLVYTFTHEEDTQKDTY